MQASHVSVGGSPWPLMGWIVVGVWSLLLTLLARAAYRRDTARV